MVQSLKKKGVDQAGIISGAFLLRGGLNGGTVASGLAMGEDNEHERMDDVLLLNPKSQRSESERNESQDVIGRIFSPYSTPGSLRRWHHQYANRPSNKRTSHGGRRRIAPGFATTNTWSVVPFSFLKSLGVSLGLRLTNGLFRTAFGRRIIRWVTPKPGHGPSVSSMDGGFFRGRFVTQTPDDSRVITTVSCDGDPGNRVTVKILCESALALILDHQRLPPLGQRGGVLTPATALGDVLVERLRLLDLSLRPNGVMPNANKSCYFLHARRVFSAYGGLL